MTPADSSKPARLDNAPWLFRDETQRVFRALTAQGHEARAVGGAVRNALLGEEVRDVDIATTARPEVAVELARAAGLAAVPTGIDHGTVTVIANHQPFEVTTLRRDVATYGRHADVAFTDDWRADASRRDFTINALYCASDGTIHDPLGGYPDVLARRIVFIGDAAERIREDYLRILRFFRLTAQYADGPPDPAGLSASVRERGGLAQLSGERIREELLRLLVAKRAVVGIVAMLEHGLLSELLGAVPQPTVFRRVVAIEKAQGLAPDSILRLGALVIVVREDATRLTARLKLSNVERVVLHEAAVEGCGIHPDAPIREAKALLYRVGPDVFRRRTLLAWARSLASPVDDARWNALVALPQQWPRPKFPVAGADVLALGVPAGPRIGELLNALEAWWIAREFAGNRDTLLEELGRRAADKN